MTVDTPHSIPTLKEGRDLSYAFYGADDGFPVFYFHGTPSSRLEAGFAHDAACDHGFRLIATDRPGFGHSGFQENRRFSDWPNDVLALADHLELHRFGVAGHSGAGPHLFSCGVFIDPARLCFIGALGPWGPVASPEIVAALNPLDRFFANLSKRMPWIMQAGFAPMGWAARHRPNLFAGLLKRSVSDADKIKLDDEAVAKRFRTMEQEAFRQGSRGAAHEAYICYTDWGFDIADIKVPTHIWLGTEDIFVKNEMGRHLENTIPGVDFHWVEGAGHLNIENWHDILGACRQTLDGQQSLNAPDAG